MGWAPHVQASLATITCLPPVIHRFPAHRDRPEQYVTPASPGLASKRHRP